MPTTQVMAEHALSLNYPKPKMSFKRHLNVPHKRKKPPEGGFGVLGGRGRNRTGAEMLRQVVLLTTPA